MSIFEVTQSSSLTVYNLRDELWYLFQCAMYRAIPLSKDPYLYDRADHQ